MLRRRDNSRGRWHVLNALEMSILGRDEEECSEQKLEHLEQEEEAKAEQQQ